MDMIYTEERLEYKRLFTVNVDKNKLICEYIGVFEGGFILHRDITVNNSSGYGTDNEYYSISGDEYQRYVDMARKNRQIGFFEARKLKKLTAGNSNEPAKAHCGTISSFEIVTLRETGMRGANEREIVMKDGMAEVSAYGMRYENDRDERVLISRAVCSECDILQVLNDCKILSWNGFNGPHPKGVLDGIMFRFDGVVNGGTKIHASGSQNFPKHYREFTDALYNILHGKDANAK